MIFKNSNSGQNSVNRFQLGIDSMSMLLVILIEILTITNCSKEEIKANADRNKEKILTNAMTLIDIQARSGNGTATGTTTGTTTGTATETATGTATGTTTGTATGTTTGTATGTTTGTATEAIAADKAVLAITYGGSDSASSVTQNITLATTGSSGTTITWASTNAGVIAINGTVSRPTFTAGDAAVTVTAILVKAGGTTDTKVFNLTVIKAPQTATEAIAVDKAALVIAYGGSDSAGSVTQNVTLATTGSSGTIITWASTNAGVIAINGTVSRPTFTAGDAAVTVTATITKAGGLNDTRVFTLTVIKGPQTATEAIAADKAALVITYAGSDSSSNVTQNFTVSVAGSSATTISWSSNNGAVAIAGADATVTRPIGINHSTVTLTATISKTGGVSETKDFTITVKRNITGTTALRVYGQDGSFTTVKTLSAYTLNTPSKVVKDTLGGTYIADYNNNRVLYYSGTNTVASRVYGQGGSFITNTANKGGLSADSLNKPTSVAVDAGGVYIVDNLNNRALYYSGTSTTATRVYGQAGSFSVGTANNGGVRTANSLSGPIGIKVWTPT